MVKFVGKFFLKIYLCERERKRVSVCEGGEKAEGEGEGRESLKQDLRSQPEGKLRFQHLTDCATRSPLRGKIYK